MYYIWDTNTLSTRHALMAQLPPTHCNDILKSLAIIKGFDINLATYLKHAVATSVSHCTLNYMDMFLNIICLRLYVS